MRPIKATAIDQHPNNTLILTRIEPTRNSLSSSVHVPNNSTIYIDYDVDDYEGELEYFWPLLVGYDPDQHTYSQIVYIKRRFVQFMQRLYYNQDKQHRYRIVQHIWYQETQSIWEWIYHNDIIITWTNCPNTSVAYSAKSEVGGQTWTILQGDEFFGMVGEMATKTEASSLSAFYHICNYLSRLDYAYARYQASMAEA